MVGAAAGALSYLRFFGPLPVRIVSHGQVVPAPDLEVYPPRTILRSSAGLRCSLAHRTSSGAKLDADPPARSVGYPGVGSRDLLVDCGKVDMRGVSRCAPSSAATRPAQASGPVCR